MAAPQRLVFHQLDDPALWDPTTTGITLTSVSFGAAGATTRQLNVTGVSRGIITFDIDAQTEVATATQTITLSTGQRVFEAAIDVDAAAATCTIAARDTSQQYDRVAFHLLEPLPLDFPDAQLAQLGPERYRFGAGISDRVIERRSFSLLFKPSEWGLIWSGAVYPHAQQSVVDGSLMQPQDLFVREAMDDPSIPAFKPPIEGFEIDLTRFAANVTKDLTALYAEFRKEMTRNPSGSFDQALSELRGKRAAIVRAALTTVRKPLSNSVRTKAKKAVLVTSGRDVKQAKRKAKKAKKSAGAAAAANAGFTAHAGVLMSNGVATLITSPAVAENDLVTMLLDSLKWSDFSSRIGILFSDRLRFQPAGLVVGEPVYTLALTPTEEVQVRQTVETKRKSVSEDVVTREQERELTLSSTWSTDISEAITDTTTVQLAGSVFGSGGGQVPEVPLSGNVGTSASASAANTYTTQRAIKLNQQLSAQATAKMRREHKTRIEITSEQSTGFSTTRTLRNPNQQRSTTHVFSKVYRRERVTLERYDARLCLRIVVDDPAAALRDRFVQRLQQLVRSAQPPSDQGGENTEESAPKLTDTTNTPFSVPRDEDGVLVKAVGLPFLMWFLNNLENMYGSSVEVSLQNLGPEYVLAGVPTIEVDSFRVEDTGREKIPEGEKTWSGPGATEEFHNYGRFHWKTPPTLGLTTSTDGVLYVEQNDWIHYMKSGREPNLAAGDPGAAPWPAAVGWREVNFRVVATWQRVMPLLIADDAEEQQEEMRRADLISREAVLAIRDTIVADYLGLVLSSAAARSLKFPGNDRLASLRSMFAFEEATVENVPYWATDAGRQRRAELASVIDALPINVSSGEVLTPELTAAQAILYLPINPGFEREALALLDDLSYWEIDWLVTEIDTLRNARFPSTGTTNPDYATVTGPLPPVVTPNLSTAWANDWEKPQRKFDVLASWQEQVPTDGVHVETILSDSVATDEERVSRLERQRPQE